MFSLNLTPATLSKPSRIRGNKRLLRKRLFGTSRRGTGSRVTEYEKGHPQTRTRRDSRLYKADYVFLESVGSKKVEMSQPTVSVTIWVKYWYFCLFCHPVACYGIVLVMKVLLCRTKTWHVKVQEQNVRNEALNVYAANVATRYAGSIIYRGCIQAQYRV